MLQSSSSSYSISSYRHRSSPRKLASHYFVCDYRYVNHPQRSTSLVACGVVFGTGMLDGGAGACFVGSWECEVMVAW